MRESQGRNPIGKALVGNNYNDVQCKQGHFDDDPPGVWVFGLSKKINVTNHPMSNVGSGHHPGVIIRERSLFTDRGCNIVKLNKSHVYEKRGELFLQGVVYFLAYDMLRHF